MGLKVIDGIPSGISKWIMLENKGQLERDGNYLEQEFNLSPIQHSLLLDVLNNIFPRPKGRGIYP
jgi:hypothetical protein